MFGNYNILNICTYIYVDIHVPVYMSYTSYIVLILVDSCKSFNRKLVTYFFILSRNQPKAMFRVRVGDWDNSATDQFEQELEVLEIITHENYSSKLFTQNNSNMGPSINEVTPGGGSGFRFA